jgi:hypothetical protein
VFFSIATIFCFVEWKSADASRPASSLSEELLKPKKKKKKKSNATKKTSKKAPVDSAKVAKEKAKAEKRHSRNQSKLDKEREKKAKEKIKAQEDRTAYTKCDSSDVKRTSQDTVLLAKYIKIYRTLGGICYIIHLQKMADLEKTSDGFYSVQIENSKDPRAPAAWQTYLYCPIGKPDGTIALLDPLGDTIQMCTYAHEKKNGMMFYVKKGKGVIYKEKYVDDIKVWEKKPDED